jgi:FemAB-related protein (PEP-CTERM system-associated)
LTVRLQEDRDAAGWNAFVESHPESTFFHRAEWSTVLWRAFGHRSHNLLAEENGEVVGILPLGHIRSRLFGRSLISTPFCVYGGCVAHHERARRSLEDEACRLAERLGVDFLELRNLARRRPDWPSKDLYVTFRKEIDPDPDKNLKMIPRKQRAMVRKGIKAGLAGETDGDTERLFSIYSESVRNLGTPVFPPRLFRVLKELFGEDCEVLTVTKDGSALSSVMSFYFRDEVLPYYGGGVAAARSVAANDFMYWELMRRACERGVRVFDFGRSKRDVGSYRFKKHWGFEPKPLFYEYQLVRASRVPQVNPLNPRYRLFVSAWKHIPLGVSRRIGPWFSRNLG